MNKNIIPGITILLAFIFLFDTINASSIEQKVGSGFLTAIFGLLTIVNFLYTYENNHSLK